MRKFRASNRKNTLKLCPKRVKRANEWSVENICARMYVWNKKNEKPLCWIRHLVINWITTHSRIINIFSVLSFRPLRFFMFLFSFLLCSCCRSATAVVDAVVLRIFNGFGYGCCCCCRRLSMLSSNLAAFMSMLCHTEHIWLLVWFFFRF